ncbi:hypothetical protein A3F19_02790 [Candidatus Nomurabacteria bacterium RIFCSPHIGHO2_12_FULL_37_29]|uniref:Carbohydrate kinase PfkB domain-containing protein n=2 Tax=Parcubacteria group TaxID=1794811 RepID=A0A1G2UNC7_9BACT|nr:MAG: hypothetical protein A3F19_02790 [Candidatus Nomurabacteria bacterium RIFCSPHIGHO2_12_FULL_37_29]OHB10885.1 MAG: hypothetical protein A3H60_02030 [Candidatus Zambryskibacteria bacterium RIFCSPLOWO2_02_FULL_44_12b]
MLIYEPMDQLPNNSYYPKSDEVSSYLKQFSGKYSLDYVLKSIEGLSSLKALVIGEAIIDDYHFGNILGKSAKEPIIALRYAREESYLGGALAIANHLAGFCQEVGLLAMLGEKDSQEKFVRRHLKKNIKPAFVYKEHSPTIVKRRFLEDSTFRKLLELYFINSNNLNDRQTKALIKKLKPLLSRYDLVICADFGHGMFNSYSRDFVSKKAKFLSVNAQANAENFGYHTISSYPRADLLCLDEREIRLEHQDKSGDIDDVAKGVFNKIKANYMIVTRGASGSVGYQGNGRRKIFRVPSLATKDIDRVGAGDAFFAITSALIYNNVPLEAVCFIGNMVGAIAVSIIGNKKSVTKKDLVDFIKNTLGQP